MFLSRMPRLALVDGPTPLQRMPRIEALSGHRGLYVKRDDAMSLGLGGNKLRSLEFWLGEARALGSDVLLVAGKAASNQCRLTAAAAARHGFECIVIHNDEPPAQATGNLLLSRLYGARLHFIGAVDEAERGRQVGQMRDALVRNGRHPYVVGEPAVGALGYVAAALELHEQVFAAGIDLRHVLLPGSMGVTEAGFLFGCALLGNPFQVHLVSVEFQLEELRSRIATILAALRELTGITPGAVPGASAHYHDAWLGDGYGLPTRQAIAAIHTFARREGLLLEATYTSKTFAALLDLAAGGKLPGDEPACIVHTGGVPALFGQTELLGEPTP